MIFLLKLFIFTMLIILVRRFALLYSTFSTPIFELGSTVLHGLSVFLG